MGERGRGDDGSDLEGEGGGLTTLTFTDNDEILSEQDCGCDLLSSSE